MMWIEIVLTFIKILLPAQFDIAQTEILNAKTGKYQVKQEWFALNER